MMEEWNKGRVEGWSDGRTPDILFSWILPFPNIPIFHSSIIPVFHYSNIPIFPVF
jgi:hypothetical protein